MKRSTVKRIRAGAWILFILYLGALIYFMFLAERYGRLQGADVVRYNLTPLREIRRFLSNRAILGSRAVFLNVAGNVLAFCPFGAILPVMFRRIRSLGQVTVLTAVFSVCIETAQLLTRAGVFDVDDILLNTLGGMAGFAVFCFCDALRRHYYYGEQTKKQHIP